MAAQIGWTSEMPVLKHATSLDLEEAVSAHVTRGKSEQRGCGSSKNISPYAYFQYNFTKSGFHFPISTNQPTYW